MKKKLIICLILLGVSIGVVLSFGLQKLIAFMNPDKCTKTVEPTKEKTLTKEYNYSCEYSSVYKIVSLLDGYQTDDETYSYIVVDSFQDPNPTTIKILKSEKATLKLNTLYTFNFSIDYRSEKNLSESEVLTNSSITSIELYTNTEEMPYTGTCLPKEQ